AVDDRLRELTRNIGIVDGPAAVGAHVEHLDLPGFEIPTENALKSESAMVRTDRDFHAASLWPPNSLRMAERSCSPKLRSSRERKRTKSAVEMTGTGTPASIAA